MLPLLPIQTPSSGRFDRLFALCKQEVRQATHSRRQETLADDEAEALRAFAIRSLMGPRGA
ncbi:hypothetical protein [Thetidibacter halocola]|uniref:Uncharacterized protein n=1 Tax=Thetidibacter halocola TaxID=2827239 RepID=A0A8J8B6N5_9RHOB|nr:hypothetical protein [Thetidibacter halocola]MBS0122745.1 hypothetical protein [Thetidibacter halocola]